MSPEDLHGFISRHTDKIISIRDYYYQSLMNRLSRGEDENNLPFNSKGMYECWVNYSPFYFRDLKDAFTMLLDDGYSPQELAPFIENKARVVRYFSYLLLPGAFLDEQTPQEEKLDFLNNFSIAAQKVISRKGYVEPEAPILFDAISAPSIKASSIGRLIAVLGEVCEQLYFGDQTVGYTAFGLDRKIIPEYYTLFQDFDLNLGTTKYPIDKIQTITIYPQHEHTAPPFTMIEDKYAAQIFMYGYWHDTRWTIGRPNISELAGASVLVKGKSFSLDQIQAIINSVIEINSRVSKSRQSMSFKDLNKEYCITQSGTIINLNNLASLDWKLSEDGQNVLDSNEILLKLKKDWDIDYSFQVAFELIKRSIQWFSDATG